jgi:hypothetical protein
LKERLSSNWRANTVATRSRAVTFEDIIFGDFFDDFFSEIILDDFFDDSFDDSFWRFFRWFLSTISFDDFFRRFFDGSFDEFFDESFDDFFNNSFEDSFNDFFDDFFRIRISRCWKLDRRQTIEAAVLIRIWSKGFTKRYFWTMTSIELRNRSYLHTRVARFYLLMNQKRGK